MLSDSWHMKDRFYELFAELDNKKMFQYFVARVQLNTQNDRSNCDCKSEGIWCKTLGEMKADFQTTICRQFFL